MSVSDGLHLRQKARRTCVERAGACRPIILPANVKHQSDPALSQTSGAKARFFVLTRARNPIGKGLLSQLKHLSPIVVIDNEVLEFARHLGLGAVFGDTSQLCRRISDIGSGLEFRLSFLPFRSFSVESDTA